MEGLVTSTVTWRLKTPGQNLAVAVDAQLHFPSEESSPDPSKILESLGLRPRRRPQAGEREDDLDPHKAHALFAAPLLSRRAWLLPCCLCPRVAEILK